MVEKFLGEVKGIFNTITLIELGFGVVYALLGLIFYTNTSVNHLAVAIITGIILVAGGITSIFAYLRRDDIVLYKYNFVIGIIQIIVGVLACAFYKILPIFLGIYFLIWSGQRIIYGVLLRRYNESSWLFTVVVGALIAIIGIVIMFAKGDGVISAIGISYFGTGVISLVSVILLRRRSNNFLD